MTDTPGPEGSWPLDPQVPSFERPGATPAYPMPSPQYVQPGPPTPGSYAGQSGQGPYAGQPGQGPFAGEPGQGPFAGQPGQGPYMPQQPAFVPGGEKLADNLPPDRMPARFGVMAIVAVVVVAVIGIGVAVWAMSSSAQPSAADVWSAVPSRTWSAAPSVTPSAHSSVSASSTPTTSPQPTTTASPTASAKATAATSTKATVAKTTTSAGSGATLPSCASGQKIVTSAWTAVAPSGWTCVTGSISDGVRLGLQHSQQEIIVVGISSSKDAATACGGDLAKQTTSVEALPDTMWGGKTATTAKVTAMGVEIEARCVQVNGIVYSLVGEPTQGVHATVIAAVDALTSSWVWK